MWIYANDMETRLAAFGEDESTYLDHMTGKDWSVTKPKDAQGKKPYASHIVKQPAQSNATSIKKIAHGRIVPKGELS